MPEEPASCPKCGYFAANGEPACPACGVIFARLHTIPSLDHSSAVQKQRQTQRFNLLVRLLRGCFLIALAAQAAWFLSVSMPIGTLLFAVVFIIALAVLPRARTNWPTPIRSLLLPHACVIALALAAYMLIVLAAMAAGVH